jgi:hypothetical protein
MTRAILTIMAVVAAAALVLGCGNDPQPPAPVGTQPTPIQPGQAYPGTPPAQPGQAYPGQPAQPVPAPVPPAQPVQPGQPAPPAQPAQPGQPGQQGVPQIGDLLGALGQMAGQQPTQPGQQPAAVTHIPWQSLSQALPTATPGWTLSGEVQGESLNMMGISVSQAGCDLVKGNLKAEVQIIDTTMNPMIAMPFNMARSMQIDSSEQRVGPINFGVYPGTQKLDKRRNKTEIMVMVHNRVLVKLTVEGSPTEAEAQNLGRYVNYAMLATLVGG